MDVSEDLTVVSLIPDPAAMTPLPSMAHLYPLFLAKYYRMMAFETSSVPCCCRKAASLGLIFLREVPEAVVFSAADSNCNKQRKKVQAIILDIIFYFTLT
jgi:hypothetical protein